MEQPHAGEKAFPPARRTFLLAGLTGLLMPRSVVAQAYLSNVIRIVVLAGAGMPLDIISRTVVNEIAANEGWRLVVENRPARCKSSP